MGAKKTKSRSQALGLKKLEKSTVKTVSKRLYELNRIISTKELEASLLKRAKEYRGWCRSFLNKRKVNPDHFEFRQKSVAKSQQVQMQLDGFLNQMDVVKISELMAKKIQTELREELNKVLRKAKRKSA
jgi:hypothetical protein